jgi:hypothetical protein
MNDPTPAPSVHVRGETEIVLEPEALQLKRRRFNVSVGGGVAEGRTISAESVRSDAIALVAKEARKALCGSRAKLVKQIDRARKENAPPAR